MKTVAKRKPAKANTITIPKFIINPAYAESEDRRDEALRISSGLDDYWTLIPEDCGAKLPSDGAWIMVKRPPATEFTVPAFSMWYAMEEVRPHAVEGQARHLAQIVTPRGSLWLWPGEYVVVRDISNYFDFPDDHIHINLLGGDSVNADKLFYIRSRGISKKDGIKMLLGDVKSQDVAYVTVHPAYARCFGVWEPPAERLAMLEEWAGEPAPNPKPIDLGEPPKKPRRRKPVAISEL